VTQAAVPSASLSLLAALAILILSRLEDNRSIRPSFLLNIYLLVSVVFDAVQVRTLYLRHDDSKILGLFTASIFTKSALLLLESRSKRIYLRPPYSTYSPEETSGIFNISFFWWLSPILASGFRKLLTLDDLFTTDNALLSEPLGEQMQQSWNKCRYHPPRFRYLLTVVDRFSGRWAVAFAILHCLRWSLASIIFPRLCLIGFNYAQPYLISAAIENISQQSNAKNKNVGYGLIGATALIYLGIAV
jgi:ATP-binding cassette subfamily C (CFTR/MRP) protein 1